MSVSEITPVAYHPPPAPVHTRTCLVVLFRLDGGSAARCPREVIAPLQIRLESTAFDAGAAHVFRLSGREAVSRCFRFDLEVACPEPAELSSDAVIGAEAAIVFEQGGEALRRVHGMIAAFEDRLEVEATHRTYRLTLVPRAERLALVTTQEAFVHASVPELVARKLALVGLSSDDAAQRLLGSYGKRELTVQFKETDLAFVSRLAEHLGIFFFFEHEDGKDRIVLADHNGAFPPIPGDAGVPFQPRGERVDVYRITAETTLSPAAYFVQDYNYRAPQIDLVSRFDAPWGNAGGVVEYGSHQKTPAEGAALARTRAEEQRVAGTYFTGESAVCRFGAGATFTLLDHARLGDRRLLLTEVEHHAEQPVLQHGGPEGRRTYTNTFRAIDAEVAYRPPRITPRPRIHGLLTGMIEPRPDGNVGTIADLDDQGRYTIRLLFDASPLAERPASSHRVRMIQLHAGPDYGAHFPLKAGVEVLLAFMDGDPDRPLIVGSVPNPLTPSPVTGEDALMHRIKTATGILLEMHDGSD